MATNTQFFLGQTPVGPDQMSENVEVTRESDGLKLRVGGQLFAVDGVVSTIDRHDNVPTLTIKVNDGFVWSISGAHILGRDTFDAWKTQGPKSDGALAWRFDGGDDLVTILTNYPDQYRIEDGSKEISWSLSDNQTPAIKLKVTVKRMA